MERTRTPTPTLQPVATPVELETRPDTPDTRAEDAASDAGLAEEISQPDEEQQAEIYRRQKRNMRFWKNAVLTIIQRNSDEETVIGMADTLTKAFDERVESGWFGHQHESFFETEETDEAEDE